MNAWIFWLYLFPLFLGLIIALAETGKDLWLDWNRNSRTVTWGNVVLMLLTPLIPFGNIAFVLWWCFDRSLDGIETLLDRMSAPVLGKRHED